MALTAVIPDSIRVAEFAGVATLQKLQQTVQTELCNRPRKALIGRPGYGAKPAATQFVREEQRNTEHTYSEKLAKVARLGSHGRTFQRSGSRLHGVAGESAHAQSGAVLRWRRRSTGSAKMRTTVVGQIAYNGHRLGKTTHSDAGWQVRVAYNSFKIAEDKLAQGVCLGHLRYTYASFCREALTHAVKTRPRKRWRNSCCKPWKQAAK